MDPLLGSTINIVTVIPPSVLYRIQYGLSVTWIISPKFFISSRVLVRAATRLSRPRKGIAKHLGDTVATTAGRSIADVVRELGTDVVIDNRPQSFEELLSGYALVVDGLGGKTTRNPCARCGQAGKRSGLVECLTRHSRMNLV